MKAVFTAMALVIASVSMGQEAAKQSEIEKVKAFLRQNVVGKTFIMEIPEVTEIAMGQTSYKLEFKRTVQVHPLKPIQNGFYFDVTSDADYKVSSKNEKTKITKRKIVQRYELSERKSTGEVLGFIRNISDSEDDSAGEAYTLSAEINKEGALQLEDTLLMYADSSLDQGKTLFRGSTSSTIIFSKDNEDKVKMDQAFNFFEVFPFKENENADKKDENVVLVRIPLNGTDGKPLKPIHVIGIEKNR